LIHYRPATLGIIGATRVCTLLKIPAFVVVRSKGSNVSIFAARKKTPGHRTSGIGERRVKFSPSMISTAHSATRRGCELFFQGDAPNRRSAKSAQQSTPIALRAVALAFVPVRDFS
jgi:hypothetical protein